MVRLKKEAWLRPLGTNKVTTQFINFEAEIDPVTRDVSIVRYVVDVSRIR